MVLPMLVLFAILLVVGGLLLVAWPPRRRLHPEPPVDEPTGGDQ
jgi:hypothetical protein